MQKLYSQWSRRIVLFDSITHAVYQSRYVNDKISAWIKLFENQTDESIQSLISSGMLSPYCEASTIL